MDSLLNRKGLFFEQHFLGKLMGGLNKKFFVLGAFHRYCQQPQKTIFFVDKCFVVIGFRSGSYAPRTKSNTLLSGEMVFVFFEWIYSLNNTIACFQQAVEVDQAFLGKATRPGVVSVIFSFQPILIFFHLAPPSNRIKPERVELIIVPNLCMWGRICVLSTTR